MLGALHACICRAWRSEGTLVECAKLFGMALAVLVRHVSRRARIETTTSAPRNVRNITNACAHVFHILCARVLVCVDCEHDDILLRCAFLCMHVRSTFSLQAHLGKARAPRTLVTFSPTPRRALNKNCRLTHRCSQILSQRI